MWLPAGVNGDLRARGRATYVTKRDGDILPCMAVSTELQRPRGLERVRTLWRLFRAEQTNPAPFYRLLAAESAEDLDRRHGGLRGRTIVDLGCGPGFYTDALRALGAEVIPVDNDPDEMSMVGAPPSGALIADAGALPLADESVDGAFCSNLLEHTPSAAPVIAEMERVLRPGGWAYISWTNWYSPWGGHDMSPYHYLGPRLGPRLYVRRHGPPRKNPYGAGLWACHIGPTLRVVQAHPRLRIDRVEPRYWPRLAFITKIPVLREFLTWNCVIRLHKVP
jgi:SAM-dependent methyltransferase